MSAPGGLIWLASFPRSGNTWFRILLASLGTDEPVDINDLPLKDGISSDRSEFENVTLLDSVLLSDDEIDALRPQVYAHLVAEAGDRLRWIKVHDAYTRTGNGTPLLGLGAVRAAIYLVRDPRDVAVSFASFGGGGIDRSIAFLNNPEGYLCGRRQGVDRQLRQKLCGWSTHVTGWIDQADVPVHVIRYEDLRRDTVLQLGRALEFAGIPADPASIERAVRNSAFERLSEQERANGFAENSRSGNPFFRHGRAGAWRECLSPEQARRVEECPGPVMARLGYSF